MNFAFKVCTQEMCEEIIQVLTKLVEVGNKETQLKVSKLLSRMVENFHADYFSGE
jgi:septum formation topological specificity factor MinE